MSQHDQNDALSDAEKEIVQLRELLLAIYVSVPAHLPDTLPEDAVELLLDTILAAGEGLPFEALPLPWPASSSK